MVSPLSSAPAPPAPAQWATALPGKWPPLDQGDPGQDLSEPGQGRRGPLGRQGQPAQVGLAEQHLGVEDAAPVGHRPVEVGVAGGDGTSPPASATACTDSSSR